MFTFTTATMFYSNDFIGWCGSEQFNCWSSFYILHCLHLHDKPVIFVYMKLQCPNSKLHWSTLWLSQTLWVVHYDHYTTPSACSSITLPPFITYHPPIKFPPIRSTLMSTLLCFCFQKCCIICCCVSFSLGYPGVSSSYYLLFLYCFQKCCIICCCVSLCSSWLR